MRSVLYVYLIVLSAFALLSQPAEASSSTQQRTEMKQLTLADVNRATEQQDSASAVRLARQLGFARRRFGRFGPGPAFANGGGGFFPGAGFGNGGFGGRRFVGRRRFANPAFFG
ncbi:hypothetical protein KR093_003845 [Drosophila rubida]|uniref:Uncharacterized protein n=1 Tax=Drosophila rubida TaxID=30044 RepID=A0AAD4KC79_9MUSC|nr:hypothetical protein KR093_003845 [Drosophila rubida]